MTVRFTVAVTTLWVYRAEQEHAEHLAHVKEEHGGEAPAVPDYEFLNRRGAFYLLTLMSVPS